MALLSGVWCAATARLIPCGDVTGSTHNITVLDPAHGADGAVVEIRDCDWRDVYVRVERHPSATSDRTNVRILLSGLTASRLRCRGT